MYRLMRKIFPPSISANRIPANPPTLHISYEPFVTLVTDVNPANYIIFSGDQLSSVVVALIFDVANESKDSEGCDDYCQDRHH